MSCPAETVVPGTHWTVIAKDVVNEVIPIIKYKSKKTGITVFISEVEGPLVNGYFALGNGYIVVLLNL